MKYKNVRDEPQIKSYMVFRQNADIKNEDAAFAVIDIVLPHTDGSIVIPAGK